MASTKNARKNRYMKPKITKITLRTKETVLGFCKTAATTNQPLGTAPCNIANCFTSNGT